MKRAGARPRKAACAAVVLAFSLGGGLACKKDSGSSGTAPTLSNLQIWPSSAALNDAYGSLLVSFNVDVADPDANISSIVATVMNGSTQVNKFTGEVTNPPGVTSGTLGGQLPVPTTSLTTYTLLFQAFDTTGNGSNVVQKTFPITPGNPVPTITSLSPASAYAGDPDFTLTVAGSDFVPGATVWWNGYYLATTHVNDTTLEAQVTSWQLYYAGTAAITVTNPTPGGGTSAALTFTINPTPPRPVPTLTSISPASADAGTSSVTLTVTGTSFVQASTVTWNGSSLATTYVDDTTLTATVSSYSLGTVGTASVAVFNPAPGGGTSSARTFTITKPPQEGVTVVSLLANDLAWDPYRQKLYVSVPSTSAVNPNSVSEIDPFTGQITGTQFAGSEPGKLALSDDGGYLYVGFGGAGSVSRFTLPGLTLDLSIPLGRDATYGSYFARDLRVAPAAAHTLAVSLAAGTYAYAGGIAVFDDATQRSTKVSGSRTFDTLDWGASASTLYASSSSYSYYDLAVLSVDGSGATLTSDYTNAFSPSVGFRIHYDPVTALVYGDDGHAVSTSGTLMGTYSLTGLYTYYSPILMTPDPSLDSAFFVGRSSSSSWPELRAYDLTQFYQTRTLTLPYTPDPVGRMVRWGADGVAFLAGGNVVLVRGATVLPVSSSANPEPAVTFLSPASAPAGSGNLRLTVTGTGFVPGSVVQWAGSGRSTSFVSATELVAFIPASDVAIAGTPQITVTSPAPGGGTSSGVTFTVN